MGNILTEYNKHNMKFTIVALLLANVSAIRLTDDFYHARDIGRGSLDKKYERVPPPNFAGDGDDLFMRPMIMKYAMEKKTGEDEKEAEGTPTGEFYMDEAATKLASAEVLGTHKGLKGGDLKDYMKTYFPRTWAHFDVNKGGVVGVEVMPQFMRFLASDQTMKLE